MAVLPLTPEQEAQAQALFQYWLDQQSFFPLRIEEYDKEGKLAFVNVRTGTRANPALGDHGYAVLFDLWWDIPIDQLSASIHGILPRSWSEEDKRIFVTPQHLAKRCVSFASGWQAES